MIDVDWQVKLPDLVGVALGVANHIFGGGGREWGGSFDTRPCHSPSILEAWRCFDLQ